MKKDTFRNDYSGCWNKILANVLFPLAKSHSWGWGVGFLAVIVSLYLRSTVYVGADPAFYFITAENIWHGKRYYYDFFESNFPLNFYIFIIPVWLSEVTGLAKVESLTLFCTILALSSIFFSSWIVRKTTLYKNPLLYNLLIISLFFGHFFPFFTFPANEIGTKTVLFLSFILPYYCAFFCKIEDISLSRPLTIFLGILAGLVVCLKPHYAVFLVVMEAYIVIKKRNIFYVFRPENYAIILVNVIHCLWLLFYVPEYVFKIIPILTVAYRGIPENFILNFFEKAVFPQVLVITIISLYWIRSVRSSYNEILVLGVIATVIIRGLEGLSSMDQSSIPAFFTGMMLVKIIVDIIQKKVTFRLAEVTILTSSWGFIIVLASLNFIPDQPHLRPLKQMIQLTKEQVKKEEPIMVLAREMYAYPIIMYTGNPYYYKLVSLSFLEGVETSLARYKGGDPDKLALIQDTKEYFINSIIEGLTLHPPHVLFIRNGGFFLDDQCTIDFITYLSKYNRFREAFKNYTFHKRAIETDNKNKIKGDVLVFIRRERVL